MPLKKDVATAPFDLADYILTAADAEATLAVAAADGDPAVFVRMLGAVARSEGMGVLATRTGLSRNSLYKSFADNGNPLFSTVAKVVDALGLEITLRPRRLPSTSDAASPAAAGMTARAKAPVTKPSRRSRKAMPV